MKSLQCSHCTNPRRPGGGRLCQRCHAAYQRAWRKGHPKIRRNYGRRKAE